MHCIVVELFQSFFFLVGIEAFCALRKSHREILPTLVHFSKENIFYAVILSLASLVLLIADAVSGCTFVSGRICFNRINEISYGKFTETLYYPSILPTDYELKLALKKLLQFNSISKIT